MADTRNLSDKQTKILNIPPIGSGFEGCHILSPLTHRNNTPIKSPRCKHTIHNKSPYAAVPIAIRVDINKYEMPQDSSNQVMYHTPTITATDIKAYAGETACRRTRQYTKANRAERSAAMMGAKRIK